MKLSRNWLREFVDLAGIDADHLANRLTMTTAEFEGWTPFGRGLGRVVAGRIVDLRPVPDSDHLRLAHVDIGGKVVEIVCGAPNAGKGEVAPVALAGTTLPGGAVVEAATIRGVPSAGMLCSARELGLGDDHSGLLLLGSEVEAGCPLPEACPVEDTIFEIDNKSITHRPDLWGHYGFAREIAGFLGRDLRPLDLASAPAGDGAVPVSVEDGALCPRYIALVLEGLRILASPLSMRLRLASVGVRPINNIVDFTNYVMLEIGQPMHAFDRARIAGPEIRVRRGIPGEVLRTLDGVERKLDRETLVIADREGAVAIAGIMGGAESEISEATQAMILESANFDPVNIRRSAARLGLRTEAAARFEKSLDPHFAQQGVLRFLRLCERFLPSLRPVGGMTDAWVGRPETRTIRITLEKIRRRLGVALTADRIRAFLEGIEFRVSEGPGDLEVTVPSFRATKDITIEEDVIEEIGRLYGYDNIEEEPLRIVCEAAPRDPMRELEWRIRDLLALGGGYREVSLYSFVSDEAAEAFGRPGEAYRVLRNPIASNMSRLRTSLVPNLLAILPSNSRHVQEIRIFEIGRTYHPARASGERPEEYREMCAVFCRRSVGKKGKRGDSDEAFRTIQGALETLLDRIGISGWTIRRSDGDGWPWAHPTRSAHVTLDDRRLGLLTQLHPRALKTLRLEAEVALAVIRLDELLRSDRSAARYVPVPRFPAVYQDLSIIVDEKVAVGEIQSLVRETGGSLVADVRLFDVWRGKPVEAGKKSLAFEIVYLSRERTLRDDEVAEIHARICERIEAKGGVVRGLG